MCSGPSFSRVFARMIGGAFLFGSNRFRSLRLACAFLLGLRGGLRWAWRSGWDFRGKAGRSRDSVEARKDCVCASDQQRLKLTRRARSAARRLRHPRRFAPSAARNCLRDRPCPVLLALPAPLVPPACLALLVLLRPPACPAPPAPRRLPVATSGWTCFRLLGDRRRVRRASVAYLH